MRSKQKYNRLNLNLSFPHDFKMFCFILQVFQKENYLRDAIAGEWAADSMGNIGHISLRSNGDSSMNLSFIHSDSSFGALVFMQDNELSISIGNSTGHFRRSQFQRSIVVRGSIGFVYCTMVMPNRQSADIVCSNLKTGELLEIKCSNRNATFFFMRILIAGFSVFVMFVFHLVLKRLNQKASNEINEMIKETKEWGPEFIQLAKKVSALRSKVSKLQ